MKILLSIVISLFCVLEAQTFFQSNFIEPNEFNSNIFNSGVLDLNFFRCMWKKEYACPHPDIRFFMYTPLARHGKVVDIRKPSSFLRAGFQSHHETALIIHGFNGTQTSRHIMFLKDAYLSREFNVITVDWERLSYYPCYLSSISNTKLVAQCTAQLYSYLTAIGSAASHITCVGHSLGAHICGMMSNHLTSKQHKIIGLDPAKPLIENHASKSFRLTKDDAHFVQIIHTNAGFLGENSLSGHVDFCVNGGKLQPYCKGGHPVRRARCSHFLSVCYLANAIFGYTKALAVPCPTGCVSETRMPFLEGYKNNRVSLARNLQFLEMGQDLPISSRGVYCVTARHAKNCPFN